MLLNIFLCYNVFPTKFFSAKRCCGFRNLKSRTYLMITLYISAFEGRWLLQTILMKIQNFFLIVYHIQIVDRVIKFEPILNNSSTVYSIKMFYIVMVKCLFNFQNTFLQQVPKFMKRYHEIDLKHFCDVIFC